MKQLNAEKRRGAVVLANHPSHSDSHIPHAIAIRSFEKLLPALIKNHADEDVHLRLLKLSEKLRPRKNDMFI
jgi:hypothetical protein